MAINTCEVCNKTFTARSDKRTCSIPCKHARSYNLFGRPKLPVKLPVPCTRCGKEFIPHHLTKPRRFCSSYCRHRYKYDFRVANGLCRGCGKVKISRGNCTPCRAKNNAKNYKQKYGISEQTFFKMLKEQKGVCAICGRAKSSDKLMSKRRLHVDHNHTTGRVRGILCNWCNMSLGWTERYKKELTAYLGVEA